MQVLVFLLALAAGPSVPSSSRETPVDYTLADRTAYRTDPAKARRARALLDEALDRMADSGIGSSRTLLEISAQYGEPHAASLLCSMDSASDSAELGMIHWSMAHVWCGFALRVTPSSDAAAIARARANLDFVNRRLDAVYLRKAERQERAFYAEVEAKIDEPSPQAKPAAPSTYSEAELRRAEAVIDADSKARTAPAPPSHEEAPAAAAAAAAAGSDREPASHR